MEFFKVCVYVKEKLKQMSVKDRTLLFKEFLRSPINYSDGVFYYNEKESTEHRISDYLQIREHWMGMSEYNRLYKYFNDKND